MNLRLMLGLFFIASLSLAISLKAHWVLAADRSPLVKELIFRLQSRRTPTTARHNPDKSCLTAYNDMYSKPTLDIRVLFGYKDARPARFVGDHHERTTFVEPLVGPCSPSFYACEFQRDQDDQNLFTKRVISPAGRPVQIRLQVLHSSVGSDDEENRKDPFQAWQSQWAERVFLDGLKEADVIFYNGHSRVGGGPDFEPPRLTAGKIPNVDYFFYQANRPGLGKMEKALASKAARAPNTLLGFFSCASSQHFADSIFALRPNISLITSTSLLYYADAMANSLAALSALIEMRCAKDFRSALRHDSPRSGSQISGFFEKHTK